ncbi:pectate lyase, putative [Verrucomicrobiia bacterium DG1235]|nr:pectate lyase, putative [Verrucomicrobiae bacterium DG1235]
MITIYRLNILLLFVFAITWGIAKEPTSSRAHISPTNEEWISYNLRSADARSTLQTTLSDELSASEAEKPIKAPYSKKFPKLADLGDPWFQSPEGTAYLAAVRSYQCPNGGWSKQVDYSTGPRKAGQHYGPESKYVSTFDNNATIPQIRLLARSYRLHGNPADKNAVLRGLDYIENSQYPNGGWPQIYPLAGKYHDHITFNDDAITNILFLLSDISKGDEDFAWLDSEYKNSLSEYFQKGIQCVLATQISIAGQRLGWAQQYDARSLSPAPARAFEMTSLSSKESSKILDFLITLPNPSDKTVAAINSVTEWLEATAIQGYDFRKGENDVRQLIPNPNAKPLWARFYEIGSNRPLFGDRDGSIHYSIDPISTERRNGYAWYTTDPGSTLNRVAKWRRAREKAKNAAP